MNEDDVEFAARSLAFQAVGGADRGSRDQSSINKRNVGVARKGASSSAITSLPNASLQKKVTQKLDYVGDEENLPLSPNNKHLRVPEDNMFSPDVSSSNLDNTENLDNVNDLFDPVN